MPSSQNRHRIEIPLDLYQHVARQAETERTTVSALATHLLGRALDQHGAQRDEQRQLHEHVQALNRVLPDILAAYREASLLQAVLQRLPTVEPQVVDAAHVRELIEEYRQADGLRTLLQQMPEVQVPKPKTDKP
ncbi:MAG: hypothetical protein M3Y74_08610 [Chloroflexota bacterium]|nr:hypothetical protein [Chloroflexota bacterium]